MSASVTFREEGTEERCEGRPSDADVLKGPRAASSRLPRFAWEYIGASQRFSFTSEAGSSIIPCSTCYSAAHILVSHPKNDKSTKE